MRTCPLSGFPLPLPYFGTDPGSAGAPVSKSRAVAATRLLLGLIFAAALPGQAARAEQVRFSRGKSVVPTYTFERSEIVAPLFRPLENMGLYPYTVLDWESRSRRPVPVEYESLVLENEHLRVEFLPELGGRIWSAFDKKANRELFYRTTVIKPGRYNQRGGWPVGNLELYGPYDAHMLTWPGEPWSWAVRNGADGSAAVVLSHIDHFFRNKISLEVTLRPGRAFLETTIRLQNKNLIPNRYMLWTNAGVAVTEGSRFVYPMTRTIGHDSSALNTWPVIGGADLSWNKNNKNMLGVFGLDIYDNFMSIYDYSRDYGTICYTDRLLARGMKTWTFGSGLTALRHMAAYTDNDGLYMEMQSGRFIWDGNYEFIDPGRTDGWTEYWYGAGGLGGLTTATCDLAVSLNLPAEYPGAARLAVTATGAFPAASLELFAGESRLWSVVRDLGVGSAIRDSIALDAGARGKVLNLRVRAGDGRTLLDHTIRPDGSHPNAVYAADSIPRKFGPVETLAAEEIYQKGLGHEKFGQIADAEEAYRMALSKDPSFSPVHLRLGLLAMERFDFPRAVEHFRNVLERDPASGDAHYYLGIALAELGSALDAERHFKRILPSSGKYDRRDYGLALLALGAGDLKTAAQAITRSAAAAPLDLSIRHTHAFLLRKTGEFREAAAELEEILRADATNAFARAELWLASPQTAAARDALDDACVRHAQGYLELASEYWRLSAWEEAARVAERGIEVARSKGERVYPMLSYYQATALGRSGNRQAAAAIIESARRQPLEIDLFPFRYEDLRALQYALEIEPADANAAVLLGDLLYSRGRRDEAVETWRRAVRLEPRHFFALRDLGMALMVGGDRTEGLELLTRAARSRPDHLATTLLVANIHARLGNTGEAREAFQRSLEVNPGSDLLYERLASVEAQLGNSARALELLTNRTYEPTHQAYSLLHLYRGVRLMLALDAHRSGDPSGALAHVRAAARPPSSLGVDDYATVRSSRLLMFEALLQQASGNASEARAAWEAAAETRDDDVEGEGLFRAIALRRSGKQEKAADFFRSFAAVNDQRKTDSNLSLQTHAHYLSGIHAALEGKDGEATASFRRALEIDQSFLYGRQALAWLDAGLLR